jgi:hypothetical protein
MQPSSSKPLSPSSDSGVFCLCKFFTILKSEVQLEKGLCPCSGLRMFLASFGLTAQASQKVAWNQFLSGLRIQFPDATYTLCPEGELIKTQAQGITRGLWTVQTSYTDGLERSLVHFTYNYPPAASSTYRLSYAWASGFLYFADTPALSYERNAEGCLSAVPPPA